MTLPPQEKRTFFVTSVTIDRKLLFQSQRFCNLLLDVFGVDREKSRYLLHEFVIMRNHFHVILTPAPEISVEKAMQFIKGGFSYRAKKELRFNWEIWEKGSKEHRIKDSEDYQNHVDYIWQNPVRAKYVTAPEDFPFPSARLTEAVDPPPVWVVSRRMARARSA
jgi:putative transposase